MALRFTTSAIAPSRPRCTAWWGSILAHRSSRSTLDRAQICGAGSQDAASRANRDEFAGSGLQPEASNQDPPRPDGPDPSPFRRPGSQGRRDRLRPVFTGPRQTGVSVGVNPKPKRLTRVLDRGHRHSTGDRRPKRPHSEPRLTALATQSPRQRHEKVRLNGLARPSAATKLLVARA